MAEALDGQGMKSYTFMKSEGANFHSPLKKSHIRVGLGGFVVSGGECTAREGSHPLSPVASSMPSICDPGLHASRHHRQSEDAPKCSPEVSCW